MTIARFGVGVAFVVLAVASVGEAEQVSERGEGGLPLAFWNAQDVAEPLGKIRFGAEPLRSEGVAVGFPNMQYGCEVPIGKARAWVYGWRITNWNDRPKRAIEVIRCATTDGKTFSNAQTVFTYVNRDWQGFANIVYRPTDGALFLFSWAPASLHVFRSDDGKSWRLLTKKAYGDHDAMCITWHGPSGRFLNYQHTLQTYAKRYPDNIGNFRRVMSFRRSADGVAWESFSPPFLDGRSLWMPDADDPVDLELYRCVVFPHQGRFAMLLCDYMPHPPEANPRRATTRHSSRYMTEWAISRDGINWSRPFRGTDAVENVIWTPLQGPLIRDGVLRFYQPDGHIASLPEDRIFYVTCRSNGQFSTPPFTMPATGLWLNAYAAYRPGENPGQACIMAELQDEQGKVLPGFERSRCLFENRDGRALPLSWEDKDGSTRAGRKVRLRFFLRDAKIYGVTARNATKKKRGAG